MDDVRLAFDYSAKPAEPELNAGLTFSDNLVDIADARCWWSVDLQHAK